VEISHEHLIHVEDALNDVVLLVLVEHLQDPSLLLGGGAGLKTFRLQHLLDLQGLGRSLLELGGHLLELRLHQGSLHFITGSLRARELLVG